VALTSSGLAAFDRTNAAWNEAIRRLESAVVMPIGEVRRALHARDDAVVTAVGSLVAASAR
jgi:hypothetical protein